MPQVMGGEGKLDRPAARWSCGVCVDTGEQFQGEEAQVILHCVQHHGAYTVKRDVAKRIVRVESGQD
jgi:hypothetical protein